MKTENLKLKINRGFTLVEMMVAVSLFVVIATFATGSLVTIFDANKKAQSTKTVMDNFNLALENMTRTIRFGTNYQSASESELEVSFYDPDLGATRDVTYRLNAGNKSIEASEDGGEPFQAITSSDVKVEYLKFYVYGVGSGDNNQPYVIAVIKGYVGEKQTTKTYFNIQTLMSQRKLDI